MYLSQTPTGLGVAPIVVTSAIKIASLIPKLFGTKPPEKPFPWRWDKPSPGKPVGYTGFAEPPVGIMGIVYATKGRWFRVWKGSLAEIFDRPGFNVGGTIDGGKRVWRAYLGDDRRLHIMENFGRGWQNVKLYTRAELAVRAGEPPRPVQVKAVATTPVKTIPVPAMASMFGGGGLTLPLLLGAGVAIALIFRK